MTKNREDESEFGLDDSYSSIINEMKDIGQEQEIVENINEEIKESTLSWSDMESDEIVLNKKIKLPTEKFKIKNTKVNDSLALTIEQEDIDKIINLTNKQKVEGEHLSDDSISLTEKSTKLPDCYEYTRCPSNERMFWSKEEVDALKEGFDRFGHRWKEIFEEYKDKFKKGRKLASLQKKYVGLNRKNKEKTMKTWIQLNQQDKPENDALGFSTEIINKRPYDAAYKFARRNKSVNNGNFILKIANKENLEQKYTYSVEFDRNGQIKVKRVKILKN